MVLIFLCLICHFLFLDFLQLVGEVHFLFGKLPQLGGIEVTVTALSNDFTGTAWERRKKE